MLRIIKFSIVFFLLFNHSLVYGQNPISEKKQVHLGFGFVAPILQSGFELDRSSTLRNEGLSYYQDSQGDRASVGNYPSNTGAGFSLGFYKPLKGVKGLMIGASVRMALTGSEPSNGGYAEAYYFNFFQINLAVKYYPFETNNWHVLGEFGSASVLTKNRFLNEQGEQNFFHQFGVGLGGGVGFGYSFLPFKNKEKAIELQLLYQLMSTRVEVNEVGDDQWKFGAIGINVVFVF